MLAGGAARKIASSVLTAERGLAIYDKAFIAYNDARQHLRDEIASAATSESGSDPRAIGRAQAADRAQARSCWRRLSAQQVPRQHCSCKAFRRGQTREGRKAPRSEDLVHCITLCFATMKSWRRVSRGDAWVEGALEVGESITR